MPVLGDLQPGRDPDPLVACNVIEKADQRRGAAGAADQPAMQPLQAAAVRDLFHGFALVSDWQRQCYARQFALDPGRCQVLRNAAGPPFVELFADGHAAWAAKTWPPLLAYTSTPFRGLDLLLDVFPAVRLAIPGTQLLVFSSMLMGHERPLDLHFTPMEIVAVTISIIVLSQVAQDGQTHWLEGVMLLAVYAILALAFYHLGEISPPEVGQRPSGATLTTTVQITPRGEIFSQAFPTPLRREGSSRWSWSSEDEGDRSARELLSEAAATERKEACQRGRDQNGSTCDHCSVSSRCSQDYTRNPKIRGLGPAAAVTPISA